MSQPLFPPTPCAGLLASLLASLLGTFLLAPNSLWADPESPLQLAPRQAQPTNPQPAPEQPAQRDENFKKLVTNVRLVGNFTMDGADEANLQREEYAITGAIKLGNGDYWALTSRIKYGDVDLTVPVPVQVKWAGNTPVITVDSVKIPGLGTFSARVLLDGARYAGTWSHDEKGGHLFGVIERDGTDGK